MQNQSNFSPENQMILRRLMLATIIILAIVVLAGLLMGFVVYAALIGLALAVVFFLSVSRRSYAMEYPRGTMARILISAIRFIGTAVAALFLVDEVTTPALRAAAALLPAVPLALCAFFIGKAIAGLDELQRRIQLEGIAIGFGIFFVIATMYGFLGLAGVPQAGWLFASLGMSLCWVVGKFWTLWRYR
jgi:hypothetical protein